MRIAFVQKIWFEYPGTMSLSGMLKANGHKVECFVEPGEADLIGQIVKWQPDMLAFSLTSGEVQWAIETAGQLRKLLTKAKVVFGGPHPTFFPEIINQPEVDFTCIGEGEHAMLELADAIERNEPADTIANICSKRDGKAIINKPRPLVSDLDSLPLPDRQLYKRYDALFHNPQKHIMAGRGCPYSCSYCYNHLYKELYGGKVVRFPSPQRVLKEIAEIRRLTRVKQIYFCDDTFTANKNWLMAFLEEYRREVRLPFICSAYATTVKDDVCRALSRAGCWRVFMGLESGSERVRREIMEKNLSDQQIIDAAKLLHRHGIKILTNNIIGLPTETVEEAWQTVELNAKIGTEFPWCSILQPYPKTRIEEICRQHNLLPEAGDKFLPTFFEGSVLKQDNIPELVRIQKLFWFGVKLPALMPLWKFLARHKTDKLLHPLFLASFAWRHMVSNRISPATMLRFAWYSRKLYNRKKAAANSQEKASVGV